MSDQKTAQQAFREQYRVASNNAETLVRAWSDIATTTAEFTLSNVEKSLGYSQEALANYRRIYQDGLNTWQNYFQSVGQVLNRSNQ